nr:nuclear transport factor 2 family protein [uncultured Flavobacterium sp.]
MTSEFANKFANEWIDAWNSHDLDKILSHYSDDFSIETPMALKLIPESNGLITGKSNVRKYWTIGIERIPNLKFELLDLLIGVNCLTIYYINTATNKKSVEVMKFNNYNKVNKAIVNYSE